MHIRPLLISLTTLCVLNSPAHAVAPTHVWSKNFDGLGRQIGAAVASDPFGGVVATGEFDLTLDLGGGLFTSVGGPDIFLAWFDANGTHMWSKQFGGGSDTGRSVAVDGSAHIIITGAFTGVVDFGGGPLTSAGGHDIFLAKFDLGGNHIWSRRFGGSGSFPYGDLGRSVIADASGNIVVTGYFNGTVDFGGGPLTSADADDIFVAKFDANGNHLWSKRFGGYDLDSGLSVVVDGLNNVVVTGNFYSTANFGGGLFTSAGGNDVFLAKFDADGNHVWSQHFPGGGGSVATDGSNNIFFTAQFGPTGPGLNVSKLDPNGIQLWGMSFGSAAQSGQIATDGAGNILIPGKLDGTVNFGGGPLTSVGIFGDMFLVKFDANGNHVWSQRYGGNGNSGTVGKSIALNNAGSVFATGTFWGNANFGGSTLTAPFGNDYLFLARFMQETSLPVLITSFKAEAIDGAVDIHWELWSDETLESFTLYRRDDTHPVSRVIASGPLTSDARSYVDANVRPGETYHYELILWTRDGDEVRSPVATATMPALSASLGQNHPNPFNPRTTIEYALSESSRAVLNVYDAAGALVARLDQGLQSAGAHRIEWDGRDTQGRVVTSGVYFYRLEGAPRVTAKKMVLLK